MPPLRLYIETSVWSHYFAEDAPQWRDLTREFFRRCRREPGRYSLHVSDVVFQEVAASPLAKAQELNRLLEETKPLVLPHGEEADELALAYVSQLAIPPSHRADAVHAALATVEGMDALVSWNYRHMVSLTRRRKIVAVNRARGYNWPMEIVTPPEVFGDVG